MGDILAEWVFFLSFSQNLCLFLPYKIDLGPLAPVDRGVAEGRLLVDDLQPHPAQHLQAAGGEWWVHPLAQVEGALVGGGPASLPAIVDDLVSVNHQPVLR